MLDPLNIEQAAEAAAYKVEDIKQLISDQITDIVRSKLSKVELDQAFVLKNELQSDIENRLSAVINEYRYVIQKALITNLIPTKTVVNEMNNIYLQKLQKVVNEQLAETQKLINVKKAEGESERKELLGKGVSLMRRAYLLGMQQCLEDFVQSMSKDSFILTWEDVLYMQLLLQYFDTQKGLSTKSHSSDLYISLDPKRVQEFKQMMNVGIDLNNIEHDV
jgi:CHASE3 domain sensor protein